MRSVSGCGISRGGWWSVRCARWEVRSARYGFDIGIDIILEIDIEVKKFGHGQA